MQLMLAVGGSANQEQLQSLRDWLLADRAVRQYANAEPSQAARDQRLTSCHWR